MNSEHITLRPITRKDYPFIEDIIRKTWKYDALEKTGQWQGPVRSRHILTWNTNSCSIKEIKNNT